MIRPITIQDKRPDVLSRIQEFLRSEDIWRSHDMHIINPRVVSLQGTEKASSLSIHGL